ncbi:MAG TPA: hypothetical protein VFQ53_02630 [Kofleriaceae bacterium]|nr:hypothetical protein [Kofleriaceae bacterium]
MAKLSKFVVLSLVVVAFACKGKKGDTTPKNDADASIPKVDPTLCDTNGKNVVTYDLNHDNRPDVWRLYKTEDEGGTKVEFLTCKQVDFDHDGRKDWVVAYNRKGTPLFQKADFDYDGKWDMYAVYDSKSGVVAETERDTDFDGKFDVKEVYDSAGTLTSVRRDRNGDGQPDLWEQYKDTVLLAILYDDDFDGKVDRREEIPGARPKVDMPTEEEGTASGSINDKPAPGTGTGPGAGSAAQPTGTGSGSAPAPKPKK